MASNQQRSRSLPEKPSAEHLRKQAKDLVRSEALQLAAAQRRLAREYGFMNWSELMRHVKSVSAASSSGRSGELAAGIGLSASAALDTLLRRPIERLFLSYRAYTGLHLEGTKHVDELAQRTERDLLEIRNRP